MTPAKVSLWCSERWGAALLARNLPGSALRCVPEALAAAAGLPLHTVWLQCRMRSARLPRVVSTLAAAACCTQELHSFRPPCTEQRTHFLSPSSPHPHLCPHATAAQAGGRQPRRAVGRQEGRDRGGAEARRRLQGPRRRRGRGGCCGSLLFLMAGGCGRLQAALRALLLSRCWGKQQPAGPAGRQPNLCRAL